MFNRSKIISFCLQFSHSQNLRTINYEMVFNRKLRKSIMFTANNSKNTQGYCQPRKESMCYNLPLHTHDEDQFHISSPTYFKISLGHTYRIDIKPR